MFAALERIDSGESHVSDLARKIADRAITLSYELHDAIDHGPDINPARRVRIELYRVHDEDWVACGRQAEVESGNITHDPTGRALTVPGGAVHLRHVLRKSFYR